MGQNVKTGRLESWRRFFFPPTFPVSPAASAITRSLTSHLRWLSPSKCRASPHPLSIPSCPLPPPTSLFPAERVTRTYYGRNLLSHFQSPCVGPASGIRHFDWHFIVVVRTWNFQTSDTADFSRWDGFLRE